jgi:molybdenum cofactor biosynthesis enzyme MoaA
MKLPYSSPKIDTQRNIVIDVTYLCNYTCNYCRWGSAKTPGRVHHPLESVLANREDLEAIGAERVVLSGGEPLLHPNISEIVQHYSSLVEDVILITNGWLAEIEKIRSLISDGLTGIAFSIDSVDPSILSKTRDMTPIQITRTLSNFEDISNARNIGNMMVELGVNAVISSGNCSLTSIRNLLTWAENNHLDYVNFNMIFDDGFSGTHAPQLLLTPDHAENLIDIARNLETNPPLVHTNPANFWYTMGQMLNGSILDGASCGLKERQAILYRGQYHFCAWLDTPTLGKVGSTTSTTVEDARNRFEAAAKKCVTGPHCHCLQTTNHTWELVN